MNERERESLRNEQAGLAFTPDPLFPELLNLWIYSTGNTKDEWDETKARKMNEPDMTWPEPKPWATEFTVKERREREGRRKKDKDETPYSGTSKDH